MTFIYNLDRFGFPEHLNGIRETLFFFASLLVVHDLYESPHRLTFIRVFSRFLIVFAIVQIPVAFLQFLKYGAGDLVAGTYGTGGGERIPFPAPVSSYLLLCRALRIAR